MSDDLQDFWCVNDGNTKENVVLIKIPKKCPTCHQPVKVSISGTNTNGKRHADGIHGACSHFFTYKEIWSQFGSKSVQSKSNGMTCTACKNFNPYAESNQNDGSFKCYSCRQRW